MNTAEPSLVPAGRPLGSAGAIPAGFDAQPSSLNNRYELLMRLASKSPDRDPDKLITLAQAIGRRLGQDGFYYWETFNKREERWDAIEGVSIDLVEALREAWGFTAVECKIASIVGDMIALDAEVFDAKNGNLTARPSLFTISQPPGKFAQNAEQTNRWRAMQFQSAVSKAVRGALEHALPAWFVNEGFRAAKDAVAKKLPTGAELEAALRKSIAGFGQKYQVAPEELAEYLRTPREAWDGTCGMRLGGLWAALERGQTTVEETFAPVREALAKKKAVTPAQAGDTGEPGVLALPPPSPTAADALGLNKLPLWEARETVAAEFASVTDRAGVDEVAKAAKKRHPKEHHIDIEDLRRHHLARVSEP